MREERKSSIKTKDYKNIINTMNMEVDVIRKWFTARTTIGELYIDGEFFCYTLEDTVRAYGIKVMKETAIPSGMYDCELSLSQRFKRTLPMVFTEDNKYEIVKKGIGFKGVRFHGGNTHKDTEGCILVAYNKIDSNTIQGTAERDLVNVLKDADTITLNVLNSQVK